MLAYGAIAVLLVGTGLYFTIDRLTQASPSDNNQTNVLSAAIIDQLGMSQANETFIEETTALLNEAGFAVVDYYEWEFVTVDFYRNLPTHDYNLIILRAHSAAFNPERRVLDFFTSEPYNKGKYVGDQLKDRVRAVAFEPYEDGDPVYFGITADFVRSSMKGEFHDTTFIMMGCDGMKYDDMAKAFIEKGADIYIGWNQLVSASHTDQSTVDLLRRFVVEGQTIEEAIAGTTDELGADPNWQSVLSYYPAESGSYTITTDICN